METVVSKLNTLLATYQVYYQNLRGFHWNVVGQNFFELHAQFETLFNEAALSADEIAERILALGGTPIHTYEKFLEISQIVSVSNISDGRQAIEKVRDNISIINGVINDLRESEVDHVTESLMDDYARANEKYLWMTRAYLN